MRTLALLSILLLPLLSRAQDSLVEVNGLVFSKDSLKVLPAVSVMIRGTNRGTMTNDRGAFGIVAYEGQEIEFTSVGYKPITIRVEAGMKSRALAEIMETDTTYLSPALIRSFPSRGQFEHDFLSGSVSDKDQRIAEKNLDPATLKMQSKSVPLSASESTGQALTQGAKAAGNVGQVPPAISYNLLNLMKPRKKKKHPILPPSDSTIARHP